MQERRTEERVRVNLNARWEGLRTQGRGAISDLSATGCFVLSGGQVANGDLIRLEIDFSGDVVIIWGQVVYSISEMGFALRFVFGSEDQQRMLIRLIRQYEMT